MGAECRFTAVSGAGLQKNADGRGPPFTIDNVYQRTLGSVLDADYNFAGNPWRPTAVFM